MLQEQVASGGRLFKMRLALDLVGLLVLIVIIFPVALQLLLQHMAKKEISNIPKVPMSLCDKHGAYPASASLHITAAQLGVPDLDVVICPMCWNERNNIAKELLK